MKVAKFFKSVTTDGHLPIGVGVFIVGTLVYIFHGLDGDFVAFTTSVLAFLAGHEWMEPDPVHPSPHVKDDE